MRTLMLSAATAATLALAGGCTEDRYGRPGYYGSSYGADWDAPRNYRDGNYSERRLSRNDRIWRGQDGRYYCRRDDGTAGLIIGGAAGGVLGSIIAPGGSEVIGALLGAGAGAALGRELDRGEVRCR